MVNAQYISLLDEADFFRKAEQEDVRHVTERYIAKSFPFKVMVSTSMQHPMPQADCLEE